MVVLTLSKCSPGLKGDVTKWLIEVSAGVYVGKISARVRELLWKRVCEYSGSGEATMVFSARNEQGFSFYVHNSTWRPVEFEGIALLKKPLPQKSEKNEQKRKAVKKDNGEKEFQRSSKEQRQDQRRPVDISSIIAHEGMSFPLDFVAISCYNNY